MTKKMLKFVDVKQETPVKVHPKEKVILRKFTTNSLQKKQKNSQVDVLNAESRFVKYIAH